MYKMKQVCQGQRRHSGKGAARQGHPRAGKKSKAGKGQKEGGGQTKTVHPRLQHGKEDKIQREGGSRLHRALNSSIRCVGSVPRRPECFIDFSKRSKMTKAVL